MIKKPEKKKGDYPKADYYGNLDEAKSLGYNQACDDWEAYLKQATEPERIANILDKYRCEQCYGIPDSQLKLMSQAISKAIRGE